MNDTADRVYGCEITVIIAKEINENVRWVIERHYSAALGARSFQLQLTDNKFDPLNFCIWEGTSEEILINRKKPFVESFGNVAGGISLDKEPVHAEEIPREQRDIYWKYLHQTGLMAECVFKEVFTLLDYSLETHDRDVKTNIMRIDFMSEEKKQDARSIYKRALSKFIFGGPYGEYKMN